MEKKKYVIKLGNYNCWIAGWEQGDPPRTLKVKHARIFKTKRLAEDTIIKLKELYPIRNFDYKVDEY